VANLGMQWAFGVVGLAVAIPIDFGALLITSAILGYLLLDEHVSLRTVAALGLLLLAVALLGCGAPAASQEVNAAAVPSGLLVALAIALCCLAGVIYATFGAVARHCMKGSTSMGIVMFMTTFMGTVSLGPMSVGRLGLRPLLETPWEQYGWMFSAGLFNLVAFVAVTKGLQLIGVVRVQTLNAMQVAIAAMAGVLLFHELPNPWLVLGVTLTVVGIFLMDGPPGQPVAESL